MGRRPHFPKLAFGAKLSENGGGSFIFERFTERARQVVVLAQEEARELRHGYIGAEHLLLGLLREEHGLAARVLNSLDVTLERVRGEIVRVVGSGEKAASGQVPFTPRSKTIIERSLAEALSLGQNYIGTEHLLLALSRESGGFATRILLNLDADPDKIRNEILRMRTGPDVGYQRRGPWSQSETLGEPDEPDFKAPDYETLKAIATEIGPQLEQLAKTITRAYKILQGMYRDA